MRTETRIDRNKAMSLLDMAETTHKRLDETDKLKYPSNTLDDYYDIIHQLMEALALLEGIKMRGDGAHSELIDFVCQRHGLEDTNKDFLQQLRTYRNRISYEGFSVKAEYIESNEPMIKGIIEELSTLIRKGLERGI